MFVLSVTDLASYTMEQQGRQSLPFGCMDGNGNLQIYSSLIDADDPHGVHGIGLPNYINPPGHPGQPLLSEQENAGLDNFFSGFDEGQSHHPQSLPGHFHEDMSQLQPLQMPQTYVGHETYVRSPQTMEWHPQQIPSYQFGAPMNGMPPMQTPTSPHTNGHVISPVNGVYPMTHNNMTSFSNHWQTPYSNHHAYGNRPSMEFGSDQNFAPHGYAAPDGSIEADVTSIIQYAMAPASSTNTQPNSRANSNPNSNPNTEPSSPVAYKKRKLNAFQTDSLRMTSMSGQGSVTTKASPPPPGARKHSRKPSMKQEQLPTPLSKTPTDEADDQDDDAEYDEDALAGSPPAPWPSNKQRPEHKPDMPKPAKPSRKKSQSAVEKPKPPRRASSSTTNISRVPLTAEQKKQNHTNSEQRRRDATARSYAELYDRVPELDELGKQSTMKKLEVVVHKVRKMKERLDFLEKLTNGHSNGQIIPNHQVQYPEMTPIPNWN